MRSAAVIRLIPLVVLLVTACADGVAPVEPGASAAPPSAASPPGGVLPNTAFTCTADVTLSEVTCDDVPSSGPASYLIVGGQDRYVTLTSSNVETLADTLAFDVTVQNLIPQPLGTFNQTTPDPGGVRVFFQSGPTVTAGEGSVDVANAAGFATFTAANQPYFQYSGILTRGTTSSASRWKIRSTPGVTSFVFTVYVSAAVPYPDGYVDDLAWVVALDPGATFTLPGTVRRAVGSEVPDATIVFTSNNPAIASVSGGVVTAGAAAAATYITTQSGARPGVAQTSVSVCQSMAASAGMSLTASIASTDCFSSLGDPNGRPTTSYYADIYRVPLTAGQTITITMDSGDDLDTYLLLADRLGYLVAGNDDDDDGVLGVGSRLVYTALTTGVYIIEASTFNGLDTGAYTFGVAIN